jgi:integrase
MSARVIETSKKNQPYVMRWWTPDATKPKGEVQHDKSFKTAREMYRAIEDMQARIDAGELDAKPLTFGEAFERWLRFKNVKQITKNAYRCSVHRALGQFLYVPVQDMAVMTVEVQDIVFNDFDNKHLKAIIKGTFDQAMAEGRIAGHRLGMIQGEYQPRNIKVLVSHTPEQLNTILAAMPERLRLAILLMRGCGLRIGEAAAMETDALHDGYLEVKRATINGIDGLPKHRREGFIPRKVPIPHWLQPEIDAHVERFAKNGVLFPANSGVRTNQGHLGKHSKYTLSGTISRWLCRARKLAGITEQFTAHQLRKNYATQLRREAPELRIDWSDVKEWLGHKDMTADVYAFQDPMVLKRGRNLSDPRVNG